VHYIRTHTLHRTIASCTGYEDDIVYGKVGCSAKAFQDHVSGRKITNAGQQGKYFYITFDKPPHAVLHLGMTGWVKFNTEDSRYYKQAKANKDEEEWPPKYMKFLLKFDKEKVDGEEKEPVEVAFVDPRRLARIRLVDCPQDEIRQHSPLKENGPDPVVDKDVLTNEFLTTLLRKKKVPVKALVLDQANISGIGNWVADEVLYQARIHPEQYSNTFDNEQIKRLHDAIVSVCTTAVTTLADSSQFPETWLMKYRWNKGKKDSNVLPNGKKIVHLKVGGRTSAIVPSVQKKTAAVAGDVGSTDVSEAEKPAKGRKRKVKEEDEEEVGDEEKVAKLGKRDGKAKKAKVEIEEEQEEKPAVRSRRGKIEATTDGLKEEDDAHGGAEQEADARPAKKANPAKNAKSTPKKAQKLATSGTRKSARTRS